MGRNILKSSVQNASFSIIFQILFRCITFVLNAFIIRTVGQEVLGIMNVRLLLLESTILFLSHEPLMKACLTDTKSHNWAQVINQIWLSVPMTAVLSLVLVYIWINILSPTGDNYVSQYRLGCYSIALSCIIEQMTQSVVLVAQSYCFVKLKVVLETIYIVSRTVIFVCTVVKHPNDAINAFSIAQLGSAVILCLSYYGFFFWYIRRLNLVKKGTTVKSSLFTDMNDFPFSSIMEFFPGIMENGERILNQDLCLLTISFAKQSIIKQILTEGERYVMTVSPVLTFSQQSMYDIVNNLGSLAARFIFRPIEESAYFYFTQMIKRDEPVDKQDQRYISESANVLSHLCNIVTCIGLTVVVFGQSYSHTLLYLYGGKKLVENTLPVTLLRFHSFAIVLLAINGVTEGYVFATMNNKQLDRYNYIMVIFSVSFLVISYVLTNALGPVGFILANCFNMLARIIHSLIYINKKYKGTVYKPLEGLIPSKKFLLTLAVSGVVTKISDSLISSIIVHILIGAVFFLASFSIWAIDNKSILKLGYNKYKRRMSTKTD
ncbi:Protein RFT1 homolog-like Protein [Tribolium castaneum]|uniref:Protein RFT1 homolog n=1 Tax=Tribolium castaneum TaxID=7070 RepID=D6WVA5_TRICA|nr:PREDICTED: protein RFT1 homolog [Tribolium castaneum]EFA07754.1 Protein RFT1 homolog-like Protein [Tribolium castaneum]|eukprot:XP_975124.1 PREDICTED: protein RFT1 homolog [Tribolium castaneum]